MQRRFLAWVVLVGTGIACSSMVRATMDKFNTAESVCAQTMGALGHALRMYAMDYDEYFPLAYERVPSGAGWRWDMPAQVPAGWQGSHAPDGTGIWANALSPYLKISARARADMLRCPATLPQKVAGVDYAIRVKSPQAVSYTYNGYLHGLSVAYVENPLEQVPGFWEGLGRTHLIGFAVANPYLRCDDPNRFCQFQRCENPSSHYPRGEVRLPTQSVWIHSRGMLLVSLEGQVRAVRLGARFQPQDTDPNIDPFTQYDLHGVPHSAHTDACGYIPLFAPR